MAYDEESQQRLLDKEQPSHQLSDSEQEPAFSLAQDRPSLCQAWLAKSRMHTVAFIGVVAAAVPLVLVLVYFSFDTGLPALPFFAPAPAWPTSVGYEGPTPTGNEALAAATAYPFNSDTYPLRNPSASDPFSPANSSSALRRFGNLSPWYSVNHGVDSSPEVPSDCTLEQVHLLHRHGARYPTTGAGVEKLRDKLAASKSISASGDLSFLNGWSYQLGAEILTPFGREQLFNLGSGFRVKYGGLLNRTEEERAHLPVFRTESQDRMLKSALNFAAGFWGIPFEDQYHQLIMIESPGFNNTLAPYYTCENANRPDLHRGGPRVAQWKAKYLADAVKRLQPQISGFEVTVEDAYNMQMMCAYETVALGGSAFCELFSDEEFDGFEYANAFDFWYGASFGHPAQAAMGLGWVQEWLARVTKTPITVTNSSTNSSYLTEDYFPLDQSVYVDATHDTVISAIATTLNLSSLATSGDPPTDHIPDDYSFVVSKIAPFASNLHSQIMSCPASSASSDKDLFVRWILNDGVMPLSHIPGCGDASDGRCSLDAYVSAITGLTQSIDWAYDCLADYTISDEDVIVDGRPPRR